MISIIAQDQCFTDVGVYERIESVNPWIPTNGFKMTPSNSTNPYLSNTSTRIGHGNGNLLQLVVGSTFNKFWLSGFKDGGLPCSLQKLSALGFIITSPRQCGMPFCKTRHFATHNIWHYCKLHIATLP
jgi:hypothetical protein